jgi:hypothetical protein
MSRDVLYVAHQLAPRDGDTLDTNLQRAMRWLAWLRRTFRHDTFIAPWIAACLAGADDADAAQREAGLRDACAVIERCDGIVLCGPRVSSGMRREVEHGMEKSHVGFLIYDFTRGALVEPPATGTGFDGPCPWTIAQWYDGRSSPRWSEVTR